VSPSFLGAAALTCASFWNLLSVYVCDKEIGREREGERERERKRERERERWKEKHRGGEGEGERERERPWHASLRGIYYVCV